MGGKSEMTAPASGDMSSEGRVGSARSQSRRHLWRMLGTSVVAALALLAALWWQWLEHDPKVPLPPLRRPSPNAHDYFLRAGRAVVKRYEIDHSLASTPSNAAERRTRRAKWYSPQEKVGLLRANREALRLFRQGLGMEYEEPLTGDLLDPSRYVAAGAFRTLCRLLLMESQVRSAAGDASGAVASRLDAIQFGLAVTRSIDGGAVGNACERIGLLNAVPLVESLDQDEARAAARRLETMLGRRVALADALAEQEWRTAVALAGAMRRRAWRRVLVQELLGTSLALDRDQWQTTLQVYTTGKQQVVDHFRHTMREYAGRATLPYRQAVSGPPIVTGDPISQGVIDTWTHALWPRLTSARAEAGSSTLLMLLALRGFRVEKGRYPETLQELVPGWLQRVPADPFAAGAPLRYHRRGSRFVLYSVGPDGVDDGGRPLHDPSKSEPRSVWPDSLGDVVAGLNQ
jgi:hypothetical protein